MNFSSFKAVVALGFTNNTILIWNWQTQEVIQSFTGSFSHHTGLKFLSSSLLAAPSIYNLIHIWNLTNSIVKLTLNDSANCFELLENGYLASSSLNSTIDIWNLKTGMLVYSIKTEAIQIYLMQSSISNFLFSGDINGNISIWDTNSYTLAGTLSGHTKAISGMVMVANGNLVSASEDNWIIIWEIIGSQVNSFNPFNSSILSIEIIGENTIAVGGLSNMVLIIEIDENNGFNVINRTYVTDANVIDLQLTFENILLIATSDGNLNYFDINTWQLEQTIPVGSGLKVLEIFSKNKFHRKS